MAKDLARLFTAAVALCALFLSAAPAWALTITSPAAGSTVSGTISITCSPDPRSVSAEFFVDGSFLAPAVTIPPCSKTWGTKNVPNGSHTIKVEDFHRGGKKLGTASENVTVANDPPTPTPTPTATPSGTPTATPTPTPKPTPTPTPTPTAAVPPQSPIVLVMEENHSLSEVESGMPYLMSLAAKGGLGINYYANMHPSLPNYLWIGTGSNDGVTVDECESALAAPLNVDNIAREMTKAGLKWKAYEESLPSVGSMVCSTSSGYVQKHDWFAYLSDVVGTAEQDYMVPFTQFATDLANNALPAFSLVTPNVNDDAHTGTLAQADSWLQTNIGPLLASKAFQAGGSGLLIVVFDEGTTDVNGGGQVAIVLYGPKVKVGYQSTKFYQHQSTLRTVLEAMGITTFPQYSATAPDMADFFTTP